MDFKQNDDNLEDDLVIEGKYYSLNDFEKKNVCNENKAVDLKSRIKNLTSRVENLKSGLNESVNSVSSSNEVKNVSYNVPYGIDRRELEEKIQSLQKNESIKTISDESPKVRNIFIEKESTYAEALADEKKEKPRKLESNLNLNWYLKASRWATFFIVFYSMLILIRKYFENTNVFAQSIYWFDSLQWPFEIAVFIFVSYVMLKKKNRSPKENVILCAIIGFQSGVFIAIAKLFFYRQIWDIFYFSTESIFLALTGLVIGFVFGVVLMEQKIYSSKQEL